MKVGKIIWDVVKVVLMVAVVVLVVWFYLGVHHSMVEQAAFMAKAKASQTMMPREHIYIDPHQVVKIREMPLGSRGWAIAEAIVVGKGGRCLLDLDEYVELKVKPDRPAVELRYRKDGFYEATVLDSSISWEPKDVTGSEHESDRSLCYFPLRVSFADSQKADAR